MFHVRVILRPDPAQRAWAPRALSTPTPSPNLFNFSNRLGLPPLLPSLVSAAIMEVPERVAKRVIINVKPGSKYREEA